MNVMLADIEPETRATAVTSLRGVAPECAALPVTFPTLLASSVPPRGHTRRPPSPHLSVSE
jgi:hypothetical protein